MLIEGIHIKNFRCLQDISISCGNLLALLGRNGAGKSTILKAIDVFYDLRYRPDEEDFCDKNTEDPIEITVNFGSLLPEEKDEFSKYVKDSSLAVKKIIPFGEQGTYHSFWPQIPDFVNIRATQGARDKISAYNALVAEQKLPDFSTKIRSETDCISGMEQYELAHPELCEPTEGPFYGARQVGGGRIDKFTKFVLIPAIKEVADETSESRGTVINKLLDVVVMRRINQRKDVIKFKEEFEKRALEVFNADNLPELEEASKGIDTILRSFAPDSGFKMRWGESSVPEVPPPPTIVSLIEDGFEGDVARKGHGLQRALVFSLLQYEASLRLLEEFSRSDENGAAEGDKQDESEKVSVDANPDLILAIEEPELYQHPQRCRALSRIFTDLSLGTEGDTSNQILYATHSPLFISLDRYQDVRLVRRAIQEDGPSHVVVGGYTLDQLASDLQTLTKGNQEAFTAKTAKARTMPLMDTVANEGFFADAVLIVEGFGDAGLIWALQEVMGLDWPGKGISIIPARGKNNIDRHVLIFRGFGIPTYFLFDGDAKHRGKDNKKEAGAKKANNLLLRLAGQTEVDFPQTTVEDNFACFEFDIEHYLKEETIGRDLFEELADGVAHDYGYSGWKEALKNIDGSAELLIRAIEAGHRFDKLEEMVKRVTSLVR